MQANRNALMLAQHAIVLLVLRDDHPQVWTRAELEQALGLSTVNDALAKLAAEDVVVVDREQAQASRSTRHLDTLRLIAV